MRQTVLASRTAFASVAVAGITVAALVMGGRTAYSHTPITTTIVFQKEIARIFQKKCFQCHTPGNLAMSLTTYADARPWAVAIKEEVLERRMPPWGAVGGYGHFANDMSLTTREVSLILAWADGGTPAGAPLEELDKPPVTVPPLREWDYGAPDAVLTIADGYEVEGRSPFQTAVFDVTTGLSESRWVRAVQLNPADRRVVRYAAIYEADTRRWVATWTPGHQATSWPGGGAIHLPARQKLLVEVGYRGVEETAPGQAELGLYFADKRPASVVSTLDLTAPAVDMPARAKRQRVRTEMTLGAATTLTALWPTLGDGGRSLEVTAIHADQAVEPLLWVKDYRPDWPSVYIFRDPVSLAPGARLVLTAYYDNTGERTLEARPAIALTTLTPSLPTATPAR